MNRSIRSRIRQHHAEQAAEAARRRSSGAQRKFEGKSSAAPRKSAARLARDHTHAQLATMARNLGQPTRGRKVELAERILSAE